MASLVCYFLVTMMVGHVVAKTSRECNSGEGQLMHISCDECIRCGGKWCMNKPTYWTTRCLLGSASDDLCGDPWTPSALQQDRIFIQSTGVLPLIDDESYEIHFVNSSIPGLTGYEDVLSDYEGSISVLTNFCPAQSNVEEYVSVKVQYAQEDKVLTIAVPCMCECSKRVETHAEICNKHGNYSCNVCICDKEWTGQYCNNTMSGDHGKFPDAYNDTQQKNNTESSGQGKFWDANITIQQKHNTDSGGQGKFWDVFNNTRQEDNTERGDQGKCRDVYNDKICSGNGICLGDRCVCNTTLDGSQYFDYTPDSRTPCSDICSTISYQSDTCIIEEDQSAGVCKHDERLYKHKLNTTKFLEVDGRGLRVWINCTERRDSDNCLIKYAAMRDFKEITHIMIVEACGAGVVAAQQAALKVGLPVGLLVAALLATAAVVGYMMWKKGEPPAHHNLPSCDSFDPEDSKGLNPLYIPATSSYNNPMYGKKE